MDGRVLQERTLLLTHLRTYLEAPEHAHFLDDQLEGHQPGARQAAVLLVLFEHEGELSLLFIRRASTLRAHSGEIAFPGGSAESQDASPVETALREAWEEIGLAPERVEILGAMPPVFTVVSNFLIVPVVGYLHQGPGELRLQESEVAELIVAPLRALADPAIQRVEHWTRGEKTRAVYFFDYGTYCIWGATGRILAALLSILDTHDAGSSF
ncbi:coenzyme A pyrophosphatase [Ktedonobacter sp. SOSP1-85]|uniref:NUDIX hydrolase n=1 Tax=Ktedonobacter sp. SOSP1-85 TaxID=2778367 RepID=UPI0019151324|nr:CoA pyrophosphatase [Ktedonobacter sp. SOSP1-85]GHO73727.1 coenzyme A pyrophosphatase [Ktedonobacter sp. SOSP1-85]